MKIDWRRKLSSRKFWLAIIGFVTPLLYMAKFNDEAITSIVALIMSGANLIAYVLAEGFIDGKREGADNTYYLDEGNIE